MVRVDTHMSFLRVAAAGHGPRFEIIEAGMRGLPFEATAAATAFDLLWCEGAACIAGNETAPPLSRPLLAPGGRIAFSEAVWLIDAPHPETRPETRAFWSIHPAMTDCADRRKHGDDPALAEARREIAVPWTQGSEYDTAFFGAEPVLP